MSGGYTISGGVADGEVTHAKLADNAVEQHNVADDAIGSAELAAAAFLSEHDGRPAAAEAFTWNGAGQVRTVAATTGCVRGTIAGASGNADLKIPLASLCKGLKLLVLWASDKSAVMRLVKADAGADTFNGAASPMTLTSQYTIVHMVLVSDGVSDWHVLLGFRATSGTFP